MDNATRHAYLNTAHDDNRFWNYKCDSTRQYTDTEWLRSQIEEMRAPDCNAFRGKNNVIDQILKLLEKSDG